MSSCFMTLSSLRARGYDAQPCENILDHVLREGSSGVRVQLQEIVEVVFRERFEHPDHLAHVVIFRSRLTPVEDARIIFSTYAVHLRLPQALSGLSQSGTS